MSHPVSESSVFDDIERPGPSRLRRKIIVSIYLFCVVGIVLLTILAVATTAQHYFRTERGFRLVGFLYYLWDERIPFALFPAFSLLIGLMIRKEAGWTFSVAAFWFPLQLMICVLARYSGGAGVLFVPGIIVVCAVFILLLNGRVLKQMYRLTHSRRIRYANLLAVLLALIPVCWFVLSISNLSS